MKKTIVLSLLSLAAMNVAAQDVVVKKDGSTILAKVLEVNQDNIKYKKFSNPNGPLYTINKSELLSINYEDGSIDNFDKGVSTSKQNSITNNNNQKITDVTSDNNNNWKIAEYNKLVHSSNDRIGGFTTHYTYKFGVTSTSILSSNDIEINIDFNGDGSWYNAPYVISIRNKSDEMLYIDLANCFKLYPDGSFFCYYDSKQTSISEGAHTGGTLGVGAITNAIGIGGVIGTIAGGVSIGKGNDKSSSITYSQNRFLIIPPKGKANLSTYKGAGTGKNYHVISNSETFNIDEKYGWLSNKSIRKNESIEYSEYESPYKQQYIVLYSKDAQFSNVKRVTFGIYVQQVLGVNIESGYDYLVYKIDWREKFQDVNNKTIMGTTLQGYHNSRVCGLE